MAFVFEHVTCLGQAAMSLTALSGNRLNPKGRSLSGAEESDGGGTASRPAMTTLLTTVQRVRR